ncbi:MAG: hypothetical protein IJO72_07675 [Oscillospiraceae bacterium]|nr:hypothetical protein [Oscillospiraceae bacterium]MBQ9930635.1 hypothetical protein [Oscillospiraceae bacterium]
MKIRYKLAIGVALIIVVLLALFVVYSQIPSYDTPEAREAFVKQQDPNNVILYEETFGDHVICISKNGAHEGYHLFKKTLGKIRFDHASHSNIGGAKGYLEQNGQTYLIYTNFRENARSFDVVYYDLHTNEELHRDHFTLDGQLSVVPLWSGEGVGNTIITYDASGNQIS